MTSKKESTAALENAKLLVQMRRRVDTLVRREVQWRIADGERILANIKYDIDAAIRESTKKVLVELLGDIYRSMPSKGKLSDVLLSSVHDIVISYIMKHLPTEASIEATVKDSVNSTVRRHIDTTVNNIAEKYVNTVLGSSRPIQRLLDLTKEAEKLLDEESQEATQTTTD